MGGRVRGGVGLVGGVRVDGNGELKLCENSKEFFFFWGGGVGFGGGGGVGLGGEGNRVDVNGEVKLL